MHTDALGHHGLSPHEPRYFTEQQLRRRRTVHRVAIGVVLVATVVLLLILASDAAARTAIVRWSTMRGARSRTDIPHWRY